MAECGVSPHTLAAYRSDLMRFVRWRRVAAPGPLARLDVADAERLRGLARRVGPGAEQHLPAPGQPLDVLPLPGLRGPADRQRGQAAGRPGRLGPPADGAQPGGRCERLLEAPERRDAAGPSRSRGCWRPSTRPAAGPPRWRDSARSTSTSSRAWPAASARGTRSGASPWARGPSPPWTPTSGATGRR